MKNETVEQINTVPLLLLHILPGVPVLLLALFFSSPAIGIKLPFMLSLFLAIAIGLVPVQLFLLLFIAKRSGKQAIAAGLVPARFSLLAFIVKRNKKLVQELIQNREKTPVTQMVVWVFVLLSINGLAFAFLPQLEAPLWAFFSWVPDWARISLEAVKSQPGLISPTILLGLLMNGMLGPIVEELYFRGFLLPRMNKLGKCAPAVNAVLFSLYHLFSPWEFFTRVAAVLPYAYIVWRKKDIRIGIWVHCLGNLLGLIGTIAALI